ncbi:MAG: cation transporter, partial [Betaproteobacteria bacterium]
YESKSLLIGEGVGLQTAEALREIIASEPAVEAIGRLGSMYLGPDDIMLAIEVRFHRDRPPGAVRDAIARIKQAILERYPRIRHVLLDAGSIAE